MSRDGYHQLAGEARVCNYDIHFNYDTEPEDSEPVQHWCVVVYHNDPGTANYGCVDPVILRFMYLCWVRTVIVLDTCLDLLQHPHLVPAAPGSHQFANQLLQESLNREPVGFTALLDQSRNALNDYRSNDAQGILLYEAPIQVI